MASSLIYHKSGTEFEKLVPFHALGQVCSSCSPDVAFCPFQFQTLVLFSKGFRFWVFQLMLFPWFFFCSPATCPQEVFWETAGLSSRLEHLGHFEWNSASSAVIPFWCRFGQSYISFSSPTVSSPNSSTWFWLRELQAQNRSSQGGLQWKVGKSKVFLSGFFVGGF